MRGIDCHRYLSLYPGVFAHKKPVFYLKQFNFSIFCKNYPLDTVQTLCSGGHQYTIFQRRLSSVKCRVWKIVIAQNKKIMAIFLKWSICTFYVKFFFFELLLMNSHKFLYRIIQYKISYKYKQKTAFEMQNFLILQPFFQKMEFFGIS